MRDFIEKLDAAFGIVETTVSGPHLPQNAFDNVSDDELINNGIAHMARPVPPPAVPPTAMPPPAPPTGRAFPAELPHPLPGEETVEDEMPPPSPADLPPADPRVFPHPERFGVANDDEPGKARMAELETMYENPEKAADIWKKPSDHWLWFRRRHLLVDKDLNGEHSDLTIAVNRKGQRFIGKKAVLMRVKMTDGFSGLNMNASGTYPRPIYFVVPIELLPNGEPDPASRLNHEIQATMPDADHLPDVAFKAVPAYLTMILDRLEHCIKSAEQYAAKKPLDRFMNQGQLLEALRADCINDSELMRMGMGRADYMNPPSSAVQLWQSYEGTFAPKSAAVNSRRPVPVRQTKETPLQVLARGLRRLRHG